MGQSSLPLFSLSLFSITSQLFHHFNLRRLSLNFGNEMISCKLGLGLGSALVFFVSREEKREKLMLKPDWPSGREVHFCCH